MVESSISLSFFFFFVWRQKRTREYLFLDSSSRKHNWLVPSEFPAQSGLPDQFLLCEERSLSEEQQGTGGKCWDVQHWLQEDRIFIFNTNANCRPESDIECSSLSQASMLCHGGVLQVG